MESRAKEEGDFVMKVRLLRAVLLDGRHAEAGEVHDIPDEELAEYLIACESAKPLGLLETTARKLFRRNTDNEGGGEREG